MEGEVVASHVSINFFIHPHSGKSSHVKVIRKQVMLRNDTEVSNAVTAITTRAAPSRRVDQI
jgi:hypothetical protein